VHSPFIRRLSSAVRQMPGDLCTVPRIISLSPLSLATDVTDATLGASDLWLGTWTEACGTTTLLKVFFGCSPWLYGPLYASANITLVSFSLQLMKAIVMAESSCSFYFLKTLHSTAVCRNESSRCHSLLPLFLFCYFTFSGFSFTL
jgi:hypothetical protein